MIKQKEILPGAILPAESSGKRAKLHKTQFPIQRPRSFIRFHYRIELENTKTKTTSLGKRISNQSLSDMPSARIPADRVTRIHQVTAAPDIVRMKNVDPHHLPFQLRNSCKTLRCKKFFRLLRFQRKLLWKRIRLFHHFIPDPAHRLQIFRLIFSDSTVHSTTLRFSQTVPVLPRKVHSIPHLRRGIKCRFQKPSTRFSDIRPLIFPVFRPYYRK